MWKIPVPSRLHVFLWLLANNKVLTGDNLAKRKDVGDKTCLFCSENESVMHLFFCCCVAQIMWDVVSEISGLPTITDFESLGRYGGKKFKAHNVLTTAVIWSIWKTGNNLCFQGVCWSRVEVMFYMCAKLIRRWALLCKQEDSERLEVWVLEMERRSACLRLVSNDLVLDQVVRMRGG
jgi:hypothetical protein